MVGGGIDSEDEDGDKIPDYMLEEVTAQILSESAGRWISDPDSIVL
jgi:hypothetical protein